MIRPRKARGIFGGTMVVALVFVVAGAAFACTKFYGALTGTGNSTSSTNFATTINGRPDGGTFQWCEDPMGYNGTNDAQREASISGPPSTYAFSGWDTKVNASNPELTVSVAPSEVCLQGVTGNNRLPTPSSGNYYKVGISESYWDESIDGYADGEEDNCHTLETNNNEAGTGIIIDSTFAVDVDGYGEETFNAANSIIENTGVLRHAVGGAGGWNTVCVYWPDGMQSLDPNTYFQPANALNFRSL